jgi:hypothetical protein
MWGSPGTAHLLDFNRDGIEQDTDHFTSVPAWARFGAFKLNSLDPSGARFWSGAEGVFHELKSSWRPSWRIPLSQLVPQWFDHYDDVHADLQDYYDEGGADTARARWLLHAFVNEPAR